jgi:putative acetyltransferase
VTTYTPLPTLRPASSADAPGIHRLIGAIFAEYGFALDFHGVDAYLKDPGPYFRAHNGEFWVIDGADSSEDVAATVAVLLHPDDTAELKALYVHPSTRGRGWGSMLVEWIIRYARDAGREQLFLWSDTRFADAHRLYRRLGFRQSGERALHDPYDSREYRFEMSLQGG